MRHKILTFAAVLFVLLVTALELLGRYHFLMIEQHQLFLFTGDYFLDMVARPGGVAWWVAEFFVQFFAVPLVGASITALILTGVGVSTALVCRRIAPGMPLWFPAILPALGLLFVSFDLNYIYQGSVALLGTVALLALWVGITRFGVRITTAVIALPLIFWAFGSVAMLFALCVVVLEATRGTTRWWLSFVVVAEAALIAWIAVHFSFVGEWRFSLSPMLYFHHNMEFEPRFWFAWAGVPVAIIAARLCCGMKRRRLLLTVLQTAIAALVVWKVMPYTNPASNLMKKIDHYAAIEDWDTVIALSRGAGNGDMNMTWLNLALAGKGVLAEEMFKHDQAGSKGLIYPWDRTFPSAVIRSDIFFSIGMIAGAQEMAFEGMISTQGRGCARMLKRLVQTNLIYGAWPVAEKYLDQLDQTLMYRNWAVQHRRFLYDDAAVEADPLLGTKRRCLPDESRFFATTYGDIELVARQNPASRTAMEYLGGLALLAKDQNFFCATIESYYGTEFLPFLPLSFQEAIVIFYFEEPEIWERYGVAAWVKERFGRFIEQWAGSRERPEFENIMRSTYGDTYWYYLMFK